MANSSLLPSYMRPADGAAAVDAAGAIQSPAFAGVQAPIVPYISGPTILTVGVGEEYATLSAAVAASRSGDVIEVSAGIYVDDFATVADQITIEGVGGLATFVQSAGAVIPNGKAILTIDNSATIDNLAFDNAHVPSGNGAGIRYEAGNLTINGSYFNGNQDGLLANPVAGGTIDISGSEFTDNGIGDGYTHNIYVNDVAELNIQNSFFHDSIVGHEIKSRASVTIINNNRIDSGPAGTGSYGIDLPDGGTDTVTNNIIEKGPNSSNDVFIHYGGEGGPYAGSSLLVQGNTFLNDQAGGAIGVYNQTAIQAVINANSTYNLPANEIANGPAAVTNTTSLASEPALDTSHPFGNGGAGGNAGSLVLSLSQDAYDGNAAFVVDLNYVQAALAQSVTASHALGQTQDVTFTGDWTPGPLLITVKFINADQGSSGTRALYVNQITYDGASILSAPLEITTQGSASITTVAPCYLGGTRIETDRGMVAVERLAIGDMIRVVGDAAFLPVVWIGRRRVDTRRHRDPALVLPIRIKASAFADAVPVRDLLVSPDHAIFTDGVLVPARLLVNGVSIAADDGIASAHYFHVELDRHAIMFAEGLPAESYLDGGNRAMFANASAPTVLHGDFAAPPACRARSSCAPFVVDAALVRPIWMRLAERAGSVAPIAATSDAGLRLVVSGQTVEPVIEGARHVFALPSGARSVRLTSRAARPSDTRPWLDDRRRLGVLVGRIVLRDSDGGAAGLALDDPALTSGWWALERSAAGAFRWTDGNAMMRLPLDNISSIVVELAGGMSYQAEAASAA